MLAAILTLAGSHANSQAPAVDAVASRPTDLPEGYQLECRTNDLVMLDFASSEARKHLSVPVNFPVNSNGDAI